MASFLVLGIVTGHSAAAEHNHFYTDVGYKTKDSARIFFMAYPKNEYIWNKSLSLGGGLDTLRHLSSAFSMEVRTRHDNAV